MSSKRSHVQINIVNSFIPGWERQALTSWQAYRANDRAAIGKDQSVLRYLPCWAAGGGVCREDAGGMLWEARRELWALSSTAHSCSDHHGRSRAGADVTNSHSSGIFSPSPPRNFRTVAGDWCTPCPVLDRSEVRWALLSPSPARVRPCILPAVAILPILDEPH